MDGEPGRRRALRPRAAARCYADVVMLADGVNSLLARKAGFHGEIKAGNVALAVKEIPFMPEESDRGSASTSARKRAW